MRVFAKAAFACTAPLPVGIAAATAQETPAGGAQQVIPTEWVLGAPLAISGTGWTNVAGTGGSTIAVVYDFGTVRAPFLTDGDDEIWAVIEAEADGTWSYELPFPETAGWTVGETHKVHLLSGSLGANDTARGVAVDVTIVAAP